MLAGTAAEVPYAPCLGMPAGVLTDSHLHQLDEVRSLNSYGNSIQVRA